MFVKFIRISLSAFCLSTTASLAKADCGPLPTLGEEEMKALPTDEWRAYNLRNWEQFICRWTDYYASAERYRPPADADYVDAVLSSFHESYSVVKNRKTIPPVEQYMARFREPERMKPLGELFTYSMLAGDLYREDTCPVPKQGKYCIENSFLTQLEATGKDGRAEVARLAQESRIPPIDPWFLIGNVAVRLSPEVEQERRDLVNRQREAKDDYEYFKARRDALSDELAKAIKTRNDNVRKLGEKPAKLLEEIVELETKSRPDPAQIQSGSRYRDLTAQIKHAAERRSTIKSRIKHLRTHYPATDGFAQDRIADLKAEAATLKKRESRWASERSGLFAPKLTSIERDKLKKLADDYKLERDDATRRIAVEDKRLGRVRTRGERAEANFRNAETALADADAALARWQRPNMAKIDQILTEDAEILVTGERAMDDLVALNKLIFKLEREQIGKKRTMHNEQNSVDDAKFRLEKSTKDLISAERWSVAAQYVVEAGSSLQDLFKAASAGPYGFLIEAARQEIMLVAMPPSFVTTDAKATPAPDLDKKAIYDLQPIEVMDFSKWGDRFGKQALKQLGSHPFKAATEGQARIWNKAQIDALQRAAISGIPEVADHIAKLEKRVSDASEKLGKMNPKNIKDFTKLAGKDFAKGVAKSLMKEQIKQTLSDVIAKPSFNNYLKSQMAFTLALVKYQAAIDDYWLHQGMIDGLRSARDQLRGQLDPDDGTVKKQNDPFYADPHYSFRLVFEDGVDPKDLRIRVTFGDVELVRDGTNPVWAMPEDARSRYGRDLPEELPLVLEFE